MATPLEPNVKSMLPLELKRSTTIPSVLEPSELVTFPTTTIFPSVWIATERPIDPIMVDAESLVPVTPETVALVAGPSASRGMRKRLATIRALRPDASVHQR